MTETKVRDLSIEARNPAYSTVVGEVANEVPEAVVHLPGRDCQCAPPAT
jgi:hypothetical protein